MNNTTALSLPNQNNKPMQIGGVVIIMGIVVSLAISIVIVIRLLQRNARNLQRLDAESVVISIPPSSTTQAIQASISSEFPPPTVLKRISTFQYKRCSETENLDSSSCYSTTKAPDVTCCPSSTEEVPADGNNAPGGGGARGEEDEGRTCLVCWEGPADAVLVDCGHGGLCAACAAGLWHGPGGRRCPLCRAPFAGVVRVVDEAGGLARVEALFYRQRGTDLEQPATAVVLPATAEAAEAPPEAAAGGHGGGARPMSVAEGESSAAGEIVLLLRPSAPRTQAPQRLSPAPRPAHPAIGVMGESSSAAVGAGWAMTAAAMHIA